MRLKGHGKSTTRSTMTPTAAVHAVTAQNAGSEPRGAADLPNQDDTDSAVPLRGRWENGLRATV
ncbi:hypothetical protein GCM10027079_24710 [Sediminivirga luteola]